jgi:hypothetical protein
MATKSPTHIKFTESYQEVHDPFQPDVVTGTILSRHYQGENVQKHLFIANGKEDKPYSLGPTSMDFHFFDWPDIVQPVLDQGFTLQKMTGRRGGLQMHMTLAKLEGPTFPDPVDWDTNIWGSGTQLLHEMVVITGGIRPGSGFHYHRGFFRQICTNGLVIETLGLGSMNFNHSTYEPGKLVKGLFGDNVIVTENTIQGEQVGNKKGMKRLSNLLEQAQDPEFIQSQPRFVRELLAPVADLPTTFQSELNHQFEALVNSRNQVYEMDIASSLTSAHNRMTKAPTRLAFKLLPAQRNLSKLAGVLSL